MEPPDNRRLKDAMQAAREALGGDVEPSLKALLHALVESTLIVGNDGDLSTVESGDDEIMLALFTDLIELHFFEPGCPWTTVRATEAIKRVAEDEFDGLVIDPGARQIELSREDVLDFFDIEL